MAITLELTSEQEAKLREKARADGLEPAEYLARLIDAPAEATKGLRPGATLHDALTRIGVLGAFESRPREDGRSWSEIEGFE